MRMVSLIAAQALWIGISGTAFAGYRDLKQDMEAYTPPPCSSSLRCQGRQP
jgi:hypothetical protein